MPLSNLLGSLKHEVGGNLFKEKIICKLVSHLENKILKIVKRIEQLGVSGRSEIIPWPKQHAIWKQATEIDQFVISLQSRVSLADYTLNDVRSLFASVGEHSKLVVSFAH